jgi:hypothetical protein
MGPKRDGQDKGQKTLDFNAGDEQPPWAKNMENRLSTKFAEVADSLSVLEQRIGKVETDAKAKFERVETRMDDFEFHQRKYNLLFFGLPNQEPAEKTVKQFLKNDLEMGDMADGILLQHCHPLPAGRDGQRPVIARFVCFADRERVLRSLPKLRGKNVKVSVATDLPRALRLKRADLQKEMKTLKRADPSRILRVIERGQEIRMEERKGGKWDKINV